MLLVSLLDRLNDGSSSARSELSSSVAPGPRPACNACTAAATDAVEVMLGVLPLTHLEIGQSWEAGSADFVKAAGTLRLRLECAPVLLDEETPVRESGLTFGVPGRCPWRERPS